MQGLDNPTMAICVWEKAKNPTALQSRKLDAFVVPIKHWKPRHS